jgi:protein-tyrosine phosphatase
MRVEPAWLAGAPNARDLGGLATAEGRRIRPGRLFRAPALGRLTDGDVTVLGGVGLVEIIDLRFGSEIVDSPPDRLPPGPHVAHIPIHDPEYPVFGFVTDVLTGVDAPEARQLREAGTATAMVAVYRAFVSSAAVRAGFARAAARVLACAGRPVLYHCSVGKDRTGWLSAILLSALGVDRAVIERDYLRTNGDMAPITEKLVASAARRGIEPELVRPVLAADASYLTAAYDEAALRYGDLGGYLRDGLGLSVGDLAAFREAVLE